MRVAPVGGAGGGEGCRTRCLPRHPSDHVRQVPSDHSRHPNFVDGQSPSTGSPIQSSGCSTTSPLYEVLAGTAGSAGEGNVPKPSAIGSAKTSICTGGEEGSDRRRAGTEQGEDGRRRTGRGGEQADLVWAVLAV